MSLRDAEKLWYSKLVITKDSFLFTLLDSKYIGILNCSLKHLSILLNNWKSGELRCLDETFKKLCQLVFLVTHSSNHICRSPLRFAWILSITMTLVSTAGIPCLRRVTSSPQDPDVPAFGCPWSQHSCPSNLPPRDHHFKSSIPMPQQLSLRLLCLMWNEH